MLEIIESARRSWEAGKPLEAGKVLFAPLSPEEHVGVARAALDFLAVHRRIDFAIRRLKAVLEEPSRWSKGHGAFSDLRRLLLELQDRDRTAEEELAYAALFVGEIAAKVTYNATDPIDPFDEDTAPYMISCLHHYASLLPGKSAQDGAWGAVLNALPDRVGESRANGAREVSMEGSAQVQVGSYFSIETDLANEMRAWPEFRSGKGYEVELRTLDGRQSVSVSLVLDEEEGGVPDYVLVTGTASCDLFDRVLGRVIHALAAHSDHLMVHRWS